ncbi:MAG: hypothetical protein GKS07_05965 [Nitrosopumilus sp.]|nr:MAG: hypothetical protein GKS07_05965 [Nitrosopumilus sp.]
MVEHSTFDWEFLKELILVFVPIAATIIFSKVFLDSWQNRKEKFNLRKQILNEFDRTFPLIFNKMASIDYLMRIEYANKGLAQIIKTGKSNLPFNFNSENESEHPRNKFKNEIQSFRKVEYDEKNSFSTLKSSIILYFTNGDVIQKKYDELFTIHKKFSASFNSLIDSKNAENFINCTAEMSKVADTTRAPIEEMRHLLINSKLKNPKT